MGAQDGMPPAALADVRVLDLTDTAGQYAGKLLADLGADVILVEPPAGSATRRRPPFADDTPHHDRSLAFWYWNTSKRSLTLDLASVDGRALFRRLVPRFDVVVQTFPPADAGAFGLDPEGLTALHPGLIQCSITPFGAWGPHADYAASDLTVTAMSGVMHLLGWPDRAPTTPAGEPAAICGAIHAVQGILTALFARDRTGLGQRVEVSQQEALSMAQETAMQTWDMRHELRKRTGGAKIIPGSGTYECADGYVYCMGGRGTGAGATGLVEWLAAEGKAGDLTEEPWRTLLESLNLRALVALMSQPEKLQELQSRFAHVEELYAAFFRSKTKHELFLGGQQRRMLIGPVNTAQDLREDEHLNVRGWWQEVEHPELGRGVAYPGAPYHHAETPWRISRRPPLLGEHTLEVLEDELALSREETAALRGAGVI